MNNITKTLFLIILLGCNKDIIKKQKIDLNKCKEISIKKDIIINTLNRELQKTIVQRKKDLIRFENNIEKKESMNRICQKNLLDSKVKVVNCKEYVEDLKNTMREEYIERY